MLKFRYNENTYGFEIAENGRGKWKPLHRKSVGYSQEFMGFDGEDQITILSSGMQSGITHIVVIFSAVDSYHKIFTTEVNRHQPGCESPQAEADAVNLILRSYETANLRGLDL